MSLKKEVVIKLSIILACLLLFFLVFRLFQNEEFYSRTLGRFSENYVHNENGIGKAPIPFVKISEENLVRWDAAHYNNIRQFAYGFEMKNNNEDFAFFPFFPYVWRWTGLDAAGICVLNFILFGLAFALLSQLLLPSSLTPTARLSIFATGLVLPSTIIFRMPYTEAFFFASFALAVFGLFKNKYLLFFAGCALLANARPAVTIVLLSVLCTEIYFFFSHKNVLHAVKQFTLVAIPLVVGTLMACLVQYPYSHKLFYFVTALKNWGRHFSIPHSFNDWSVEGFGMSVASIFFVVIPMIFILFRNFKTEIQSPKSEAKSIFSKDLSFIKEYLFINSVIYCIGIFFFIILFQSGSLNGLQRYVIATPFFYIFICLFIEKVNTYSLLQKAIVFILLFASGLFFMLHSNYTSHFEFSLMGFIATFVSLLYITVVKNLPRHISFACLTLVLMLNMVWLTYLLNMFLSDGWIFT